MEIINKTIYDGGTWLFNKFDSENWVLLKKIKIKNKKCFLVIGRDQYNSTLLKFINRVDGVNLFYENKFNEYEVKNVSKNSSYFNMFQYEYYFRYITKITIGEIKLTPEQAHENFKESKAYSKLFNKIIIDNKKLVEFMDKSKESYIYISKNEIL